MSGTARDSAGARLLATGLVRESESSSNGTHAIPELPIGLYRAAFSAPGFQQAIKDDLEQTVGRLHPHRRDFDSIGQLAPLSQRTKAVKAFALCRQLERVKRKIGMGRRIQANLVKRAADCAR